MATYMYMILYDMTDEPLYLYCGVEFVREGI